MTQHLITTFTDSTGIPHNHVTKARENQTFTVVEAESKEEAERKFEELYKEESEDWIILETEKQPNGVYEFTHQRRVRGKLSEIAKGSDNG